MSLVYVGRQFRHSSTDALETIYFQTVSNFSASAENARLVRLGDEDFSSLTPDEQRHYALLMHSLFSAIDAIHVKRRQGLMTKQSADRGLKVAYYYFSQPGFRTCWDLVLRDYFSDELVAALECGQLNLKTVPRTDYFSGHNKS